MFDNRDERSNSLSMTYATHTSGFNRFTTCIQLQFDDYTRILQYVCVEEKETDKRLYLSFVNQVLHTYSSKKE